MDLTSTSRTGAGKSPAQSANDVDRRSVTGDTVLALQRVRKEFTTETAVEEVSLTVEEGELLTLLGPSGCGKTTTLRTIAGLERPTDGRVVLNDTVVAGPETFIPPEQRDVGIVFQDYALFPHMCAEDNVGFGIDHWDADRREQRIEELFDLVGLTEQRDCYPRELSGGQKQRVALARALAPNPEILLLDEPFSNLDRDLRVQMREEVRRILKETGVTGIFVTHDQEEALSISDRIAVIHNGRIEQIGHPESVFQDPNSRFVAEFLGDAGFIPGTVDGDIVQTTLGSIDRSQIRGLDAAYDGTDIDVLARPDDLTAFPATEQESDGHVVYRKYLGPMIQYRVELHDGTTVECMHNHTESVELDDPVIVRLTADHGLSWFPRN